MGDDTRACEWCGTVFVARTETHRFCGSRCRMAKAYDNRAKVLDAALRQAGVTTVPKLLEVQGATT